MLVLGQAYFEEPTSVGLWHRPEETDFESAVPNALTK